MGSQGWGSKEFFDLVKTIGEAKSKAEEERIVLAEIENLKKRISEPDVPRKKMKEYMMRLVYVEMLGHDASFGYIHAVKMTHDDNLLLKRTGYLAVTLFLHEDHDLIILIVNTIQKDLKSDNYLVVCAALTAVCRLINEETIPAVLPQVVELLVHQRELVRKKAVMALHRFYQRSKSTVSHLLPAFQQMLCDRDPSVMSAVLCALYDLVAAGAKPYKHTVTSLVSILKQAVEQRLPKSYDYHRTPAPFIQIKLLKILALLGAEDRTSSENMYNVLSDILKRSDTSTNIGNAILYECVRTLTSVFPNPRLLQDATAITAKFLKAENHNLKYMGIDALGRLIKITPECAEDHQLAVIDCLEDPDDTLKRKTLDLLYKMTKASNVEVIVERMIDYVRSVSDAHYKTETSSRIIELAERYAPSNQWFIETMNHVFELAGDLVPSKVAHDLMRLIAEGAGEEDEDADNRLRSLAVQAYVQVLDEPKLPSALLQVICWVLGEYGTADGTRSADYVIGKLCDVVESRPSDDNVKAYAITAVTKVCAFAKAAGCDVELIPECRSFVEELLASHSTDLQQRVYEFQAVLKLERNVLANVLPMDASCEDVEVDKSLAFLNAFVESALTNGARPYVAESERLGTGAMTTIMSTNADSRTSQLLRFEAYAKPAVAEPVHLQYLSPPAATTSMRTAGGDTAGSAEALATRLKLEGVQKKWGRPAFSSSGSTHSSSAPESVKLSPSPKVLPGDQQQQSRNWKAGDPEVLEKKKLAASLFGERGADSAKLTKPVKRRGAVDPVSGTLSAPAVDLLELADDDTMRLPSSESGDLVDLTAAPPASSAAASSDLLKDLFG